ncbi:response regulator [Pontibacter sp. E15-1]|uniref:response regulator n=1 Tax=Pontibacter sp. E15-1 TaxID=2919918 RepID=UPI001F4F6E6B|nr:response regulator [Pontibacter sp. E15-1]MCJ8164885.1 response regulator [Pontibacter sp. E15-1]
MKKIMLVDDMEITNFITGSLIQMIDPAYAVHDYTEPMEALSEVATVQPDIIFLDLNMPEMDGWGFLDEMQQQGLGQKVYILTSSTSELDRQRAKQYANVAGYLVKPMEKDELAGILLMA